MYFDGVEFHELEKDFMSRSVGKTEAKIYLMLLARLDQFPTRRAYAAHLDCDEAVLSRMVARSKPVSRKVLVDLISCLT